jgi:dTDP-4-dehydrorhamnose 3,5-epimerase
MKFTKTNIDDVVIIEPQVFIDDRGYFCESFSQEKFEENIGSINFIQDNESKSTFGVLRGLHFQKPPYAQAKLVRCVKGKVLDVAVDIRKESPTYGKHVAVELSEENKKQLFVPRGFAHGFIVLSEEVIFSYKVDNKYAQSHEDGVLWNDEILNIDWGIPSEEIILSEKDKISSSFNQLDSPFNY